MGEVHVKVADRNDVDGILRLQAANLHSAGGMLSAEFPRAWFERWLDVMPVLVARDGVSVVGYLISSTVAANSDVGIVQAMLREVDLEEQHFIYGPICVDEYYRRKGIAAALYNKLREILPGTTPITFIRRDNSKSLAAHLALGMIEVATFTHLGRAHAILQASEA
ncbi:GNAT family N-acetyltransferase [Mesorhizobium sp. SP-1A]|uniref:GNAT family N-acetyltransferase n=1 Tax=Mesorhizobium sp. SP-1A TaxID=3077840 RepID=UPI0028F74804|nr:GNAT family N-acetyltransferase [Mesorhizobium sp. SP-1A]